MSFAREVRPILSNYCFSCHGPDEAKRKGADGKGLRLDTAEGAMAALEGGRAVVPGHPEKSLILNRIHSKDSEEVMPPPKTGKKPTSAEIELIRRWIAQGAPWASHWAYEKPVRPEAPTVADPVWNRHPVDRFLFKRLQLDGLKPSPRADKATLVRRVALDLTGLPPSIEEVEAFEKDSSSEAYAAMVDRFLAKPAFGEHWARFWLDLARYADSAGYPSDPGRSIWAYRDYVIRSFNQNKPFDQFTIEQLAGDLLPEPTEEQVIATAFHRNTMTNNEGGTSDEEFRNAAIVDRVSTTWSVWMGSSMACAQCHTHKFDPLSQKDYFRFFAILNQTEDADRGDESPLHSFYLPEEKTQKESLEKKVGELEQGFKAPPEDWVKGFAAWDGVYPRGLKWDPIRPVRGQARSGASVQLRENASVLVGQSLKADSEVISVDVPAGGEKVTTLRLDAIPDPALPGKGAGHGPNGAFLVDSIRVLHVPGGRLGRDARYIRVELTGAVRPLQLEEVQVVVDGKNAAQGAVVSSSPVQADAVAARAVDGVLGAASVMATKGVTPGEFVEVDLGTMQRVGSVRLKIPSEGGYYLGGFKVTLLNAARQALETRLENDWRETDFTFEPLEARQVKFRAVYASQTGGFDLQTLIGAAGQKRGWNIPNSTKPQWLALVADKPLQTQPGDVLRVEIDHKGRKRDQVLGSFSISLQSDERAELAVSVPQELAAVLAIDPAKRTAAQSAQVLNYYVRTHAPEAEHPRKELEKNRKLLADLKPNTVPVFRELPKDRQRVTKVQVRGNFQNLGDEVQPALPEIFASAAGSEPMDRLRMARWLVGPENPLTARVTANRFWEVVFGVGLVRTSEEFGAQGELPVNPELLDWLSSELVRTGWDVKGFLKLLVTSSAYQQTSVVSKDLAERDPENRLLARGPRFRVTGELLRDQALSVSGLLSPKMYGKPVRPTKPNLGLNTAFGRGNDWEPSTGEDAHRRSVYTEVRRNSPYPSFTTFDAPNREVCTLRRSRTNTPLQALVTLNDPVFVEAAQALARRIVREGGTSVQERVRFAYRLVLSRVPNQTESARFTRLIEEALADFAADKERAVKMASDPLGAPPKEAAIAELAAWTVAGNVLLNLDETLMRR